MDEHIDPAMCQHLLGFASEEHIRPSMMTVARHDNEIALMVCSRIDYPAQG
jgi:hypothetical protein